MIKSLKSVVLFAIISLSTTFYAQRKPLISKFSLSAGIHYSGYSSLNQEVSVFRNPIWGLGSTINLLYDYYLYENIQLNAGLRYHYSTSSFETSGYDNKFSVPEIISIFYNEINSHTMSFPICIKFLDNRPINNFFIRIGGGLAINLYSKKEIYLAKYELGNHRALSSTLVFENNFKFNNKFIAEGSIALGKYFSFNTHRLFLEVSYNRNFIGLKYPTYNDPYTKSFTLSYQLIALLLGLDF